MGTASRSGTCILFDDTPKVNNHHKRRSERNPNVKGKRKLFCSFNFSALRFFGSARSDGGSSIRWGKERKMNTLTKALGAVMIGAILAPGMGGVSTIIGSVPSSQLYAAPTGTR